jgi:hypothetical protein
MATGSRVAQSASNRADARDLVISYAKCSENLSDRVRRGFRNLFNNRANSVRNTRRGLSAMTKVAIPPDLAAMFAACEEAYEQATREGYAENPLVIAAVTALKAAWRALHVANYNLVTAKGFFSVEFAAIRSGRASRAVREACISLHAAIGQAALEHRLYSRCLTLTNRPAA